MAGIKKARVRLELSKKFSVVSLHVVRFNFAFKFDKHWVTETVFCFRRSNFYPTFADAVFFYVSTLLAVDTNTDLVLEAFFDEEWATWVTC